MRTSSNGKLLAATLRLAFFIGVVVILYFGRSLLLPLAVGGLLAVLINPVDEQLRKWGFPAWSGITAAFLVLLLFFGGLMAAVGKQALNFSDGWPQTKQKLSEQLNDLRAETGLDGVIPKLDEEQGEEAGGNLFSQSIFTRSGVLGFLGSTFGIIADFLLMLVYVILLLAHKERLRTFILKRMPDQERGVTHQAINESIGIAQDYLRGRLILVAILTVLYAAGFFIIGLDYALLIALLVAVLSIIPYLGNIIGGIFAAALAYAGGGNGNPVLGVFVIMSIAQLLENYVLTPVIVGREVDLNPLFTIIGVLGMTIIWGPVGAIIAIPLFAITRIICSHVPDLRDYAYLLGQE